MGCCCSGHSEAAETELPPPLFGRDVNVRLTRQGWFGLDADFNVYNEDEKDKDGKAVKWMLCDAVGGVFDNEYDYYLKYRAKGMPESKILGCANMKKDEDYMWYNVKFARQTNGRKPDYGDRRNISWYDKAVSAKWIIARRARLYGAPPDDAKKKAAELQTQCVGRLQIAGHGTYWRHVYHEEWEQYEEYTEYEGEGEDKVAVKKHRWVHKSTHQDDYQTDLLDFNHKMNAYRTDFFIQYDQQSSGSWFSSDKLTFLATSGNGLPLFKVVSDGTKEATISTFSQSDPVNAVLAAFAISIKMEPKEFDKVCKGYCFDHISVDSYMGMYGGFGDDDAQFEAKFPTGPEVVQPVMGYSYGIPMATLQMATPVFDVTAVPFTAVATQVVPTAIPMATPIVLPQTNGVAPSYDPVPMAVPIAEPWMHA